MKFPPIRTAAALSLFLAVPLANAHVVPSFYMLKKMAEKRAGYKNVKLVSTVKGLKDGKAVGVQFKQVAVYDVHFGQVRSWAIGEDEKVLYYMERKLTVTPDGGVHPSPVADQLLFQSQVVPLVRALVASGVPVRTEIELTAMATDEDRVQSEHTGLRPFDGGAAWVIGTESDPAQLWVAKDAFFPLRWRVAVPAPSPAAAAAGASAAASGTASAIGAATEPAQEEVAFGPEKTTAEGAYPYPPDITYSQKGVALLREEIISVTSNSSSTGGAPSGASGITEAGKNSDDALRGLIETFYSHVR